MPAQKCLSCGRELESDEIALYKRLINRGAESFMCLSCLARKLETTEKALTDCIDRFRKMGCTLF